MPSALYFLKSICMREIILSSRVVMMCDEKKYNPQGGSLLVCIVTQGRLRCTCQPCAIGKYNPDGVWAHRVVWWGWVGAAPVCPPASPCRGTSIVKFPAHNACVFGMETPLRGRSGGHTGTAPTISFGWITRGTVGVVWVDCVWDG